MSEYDTNNVNELNICDIYHIYLTIQGKLSNDEISSIGNTFITISKSFGYYSEILESETIIYFYGNPAGNNNREEHAQYIKKAMLDVMQTLKFNNLIYDIKLKKVDQSIDEKREKAEALENQNPLMKNVVLNFEGLKTNKFVVNCYLHKVSIKIYGNTQFSNVAEAAAEITEGLQNDTIEIRNYADQYDTDYANIDLIFINQQQIFENIVKLYYALDDIEKIIRPVMQKHDISKHEISYEINGIYSDTAPITKKAKYDIIADNYQNDLFKEIEKHLKETDNQ